MSAHQAETLLASPLGRELMAQYVGWGPASSFAEGLAEELNLAPAAGRARLSRPGGGPERWQDASPAAARREVRFAVAWRSWRERLAGIGEAELLADVADLASRFGFTGDSERIWGLTAMAADELQPVARALLAAPGSRSWRDPVELADQRYVEWDGVPRLTGPGAELALRECVAADKADNEEGLRWPRPAERPGVTIGALWWSAPAVASQLWTTPSVGTLPAAGLLEFFDTFLPPDDADGADVWQVEIDPLARVLEIACPRDWQDLVTRFPRDVTGTHDGEWRAWGGVRGPWRLPDWEQVMDSYDGVHVTVSAAVTACGVALPAADGYTMLVGWTPGATLWLRDKATTTRLLGRWDGGPQAGSWDDPPPEWKLC